MIHIDGNTDLGRKRTRNEDVLFLNGFVAGGPTASMNLTLTDTTQPIVVAAIDGMGGHPEGHRASRLAGHHLADHIESMTSVEAVSQVLVGAHEALVAEMSNTPSSANMGATIAGFVLLPRGRALCFNVGDSRCYEYSEGCLVLHSTDDSPPAPLGMPADAKIVTITQALGTDRRTAPVPHVSEISIGRGTVLLACTDGLTDYASLDDLEHLLASPGADARGLCGAALAGGGGDNVTAALVSVD